MEEKKFKKEIDLDEIEMKWEDDVFPEEKLLGKLKFFDEKDKRKKSPRL